MSVEGLSRRAFVLSKVLVQDVVGFEFRVAVLAGAGTLNLLHGKMCFDGVSTVVVLFWAFFRLGRLVKSAVAVVVVEGLAVFLGILMKMIL